jgi:hypothetical protein
MEFPTIDASAKLANSELLARLTPPAWASLSAKELHARIDACVDAICEPWEQGKDRTGIVDEPDEELVEAVPVPPQPASVPRRRKPSLTKALREAKKAGIPVASATLTADGSVSLSFGETVKDNGNDLDRWLARRVS